MPATPDCVQMIPEYLGAGGATAANVMNFLLLSGVPTTDDMTDVSTGWEDVVGVYLSGQWAIQGGTRWRVLDLDPPEDREAANPGSAGTTAGGVLPAQCAIVLSLHASAGRRGRGRTYLPGVAEGSVSDESHIQGALATDIQEAYLTWVEDVCIPAGIVPGVLSRLDNTVRPIQAVSIDLVIDTQRRRVSRLE